MPAYHPAHRWFTQSACYASARAETIGNKGGHAPPLFGRGSRFRDVQLAAGLVSVALHVLSVAATMRSATSYPMLIAMMLSLTLTWGTLRVTTMPLLTLLMLHSLFVKANLKEVPQYPNSISETSLR